MEITTPTTGSITEPVPPPTFRKLLEKVIVELSPYKRILTEEDNIMFDKIMDFTRNRVIREDGEPFFPGAFNAMNFLLLSTFIEQQREIDKLNETIKALTKQLATK